MKYGLLKFTSYKMNVGDYMQLEGIKEVYRRLGICENDIIEVERDQLSIYEGEYIILPMTAAFNAVHGINTFPLSNKIIPIFIGFFTADESVAKEIAKYERFGVFGCRDLVTMEMMRKQGVSAYMSGCFSLGFRKRDVIPSDGKVYLCDPPEKLIPFIPKEYLDNSVDLPVPHREMKKRGYSQENEEMAKEYLSHLVDELKMNARLVITRRLHMALPCIAMGIPVVLAHECDTGQVEECRFSGLDRIVKVYKPEEYKMIDWNPEVPDIEWLKEKTIQMGMERIQETVKRFGGVIEVSEYYESVNRQVYYSGMKASYLSEKQKEYFICNSWKMERTIFEYITKRHFEKMHLIFYGAGDKCKWAMRRYYNYIERTREFHIVDGDESKWGKKVNDLMTNANYDLNLPKNYIVENPEIIRNISKDRLVVIVTCDRYYAGAGVEIGNLLIREYGLQEENELYFLDKLNNSMDMHLSSSSTPFYFLHGF